MKYRILFTILLYLLISQTVKAQQWHSYNPTQWYDVNALAMPGPGVLAIGGGLSAPVAVQIMFQTSDYGLNWYENAHDGPAPWNRSIAFSDAQNGFGVGYNGRIIRTDDAGRNWGYPVTPVMRDLYKILYTGSGIYYVAGGNDTLQTILRSSNYGVSWEVIYDTLGPALKSLCFPDSLRGFAVGDSGTLLRTTDGGTSWQPVSTPLIRDFKDIVFTDPDTGFIVGGSLPPLSRRTILQTVDGGISWNVVRDETGGILNGVAFPEASTGYAVGDSATILQTTNGGSTWSQIVIDTALAGNETFNDVEFRDQSFGAIGGKAGVLYIYVNLPVEGYTLGTARRGSSGAVILGMINTHSKTAQYTFVYADNPGFSGAVSTPLQSIQNDTLQVVSDSLSGLVAGSDYYYFLRTITSVDTLNGDTLSFFCGTDTGFVFQTLEPTNISGWSATLNGYIDHLPESADLYFEFGKSPAFGTQVTAMPAQLNDASLHYIQAQAPNLEPGRVFFYRLTGTTASGIIHGETRWFLSGNLPIVNTGMSSDVTLNSAQLYGNAIGNGYSAALFYEYGPTIYYGSEAIPVPDSVIGYNGTDTHLSVSGLEPYTTYHFRLKAVTGQFTSYGQDVTFITGGPSASTNQATDVGIHSARLQGFANAKGTPVSVQFEYGLTAAYGNVVNAVPFTVTGSQETQVVYDVTGLDANTTYHYRVKAFNAIGTAFGNDMSMTTGFPPSVHTRPATEISVQEARLNGDLDAGGIPTEIKFEYGLTSAYGNEADAVPSSVSDSGIHEVSLMLTGLLPETTYHFRIKGINAVMTNYGEDKVFYTGYPEIPNFDFENWTEHVELKPSDYTLRAGNVTRSALSCSHDFAVKLQNDTLSMNGGGEQPGAILIGNTLDGGQTFIGGTPFTGRPDTLKGCFNYFIPANDTAIVIFQLKKQGVKIADDWFTITGNSSGNFEELKFPVSYLSSQTPDTLMIGFVCTDIRHPLQLNAANYLIIDNLRMSGTAETLPNQDFESWESTTYYSLDGWVHNEMYGPDPAYPDHPSVSRTADAQHGEWAVMLQNRLGTSDTMNGYIATNAQWNAPGFSVNARHHYLTGYYKYFPENGDAMNVNITLYKNHVQVGWGNFTTTLPAADYTAFATEINYVANDTLIPDSARISASASSYMPRGNSRLFLDNLNFEGYLSGFKDPPVVSSARFNFNVYPNPARDHAVVAFTVDRAAMVSIRLYDLTGHQVMLLTDEQYPAGDHTLNLSSAGLSKGFYICAISSGDFFCSKKLIIY